MSELLDDMRRNPRADWKIKDVQTLCDEYGVTCKPPSGGGSHYKVSHRRITHIQTIPSKRPIKPVYIKRLVAFIEAVRKLK